MPAKVAGRGGSGGAAGAIQGEVGDLGAGRLNGHRKVRRQTGQVTQVGYGSEFDHFCTAYKLRCQRRAVDTNQCRPKTGRTFRHRTTWGGNSVESFGSSEHAAIVRSLPSRRMSHTAHFLINGPFVSFR